MSAQYWRHHQRSTSSRAAGRRSESRHRHWIILTDNYTFVTIRTRNSRRRAIVQVVPDSEHRQRMAVFGQLNVPILGEASTPFRCFIPSNSNFPGRYDHYSDFGGTFNPKIGLNWEVVDGFKLRGSWGTSFNAPTLANISPVAARSLSGVNLLGGATNNGTGLCSTIGVDAPAGSVAAILNPHCTSALNFPGGLMIQGRQRRLERHAPGPPITHCSRRRRKP